MTDAAAATATTPTRRVLLKLSGEALLGDHEYGIDPGVVREIAREVAGAVAEGIEAAIVVGGRQHLPRAGRQRAREWTARPATTWGCWRPS